MSLPPQKETLCPLAVTSHCLLPPAPAITDLLPVFMDLPFLDFSYTKNHTMFVPLYLAPFPSLTCRSENVPGLVGNYLNSQPLAVLVHQGMGECYFGVARWRVCRELER